MKHPNASSRGPADDESSAAMVRAAVEQFEGPLTIYAARLLGDVERAREVVQDTFLKLWTADKASVNSHLAPWLYRVCRNRALDVQRKEVRMTTLQKEQIETRESVRNEPPSIDSHQLCDAIESLPDKQQEAVRLKFQGGLTYQEIGNVMDITSNHVGVLIHTALKAIRERIINHQPNQQAQPATRSVR